MNKRKSKQTPEYAYSDTLLDRKSFFSEAESVPLLLDGEPVLDSHGNNVSLEPTVFKSGSHGYQAVGAGFVRLHGHITPVWIRQYVVVSEPRPRNGNGQPVEE